MNAFAIALMIAVAIVAGEPSQAAEPLKAAASLKATGPTRDAIALATIVNDDTDTDWSEFRVLSFANLDPVRKPRVKGDVKFIVETLNRRTERAEIRELSDSLWAVNVKQLKWRGRHWEDLAKKWPYHDAVPERARKYLAAKFETKHPILRADVFAQQAWQPEWYAKLLDLPTTRDKLLDQVGLDADWPKQIQAMGIVPESGVQDNPRKVAYLQGRSVAGKQRGIPLDFFVTMNYEDLRGKNDSLRHPTQVDCNYNEIAIEAPNGLDFYFANAGGGGIAERDRITDELVDRVGNGDSRMGGLVKQIPLRAGATTCTTARSCWA